MIAATPIAKEAGHWYYSAPHGQFKTGDPCLEIVGKNGKQRPPNLGDMKRGLPIVPSVTGIQRLAAAPGLEYWKMQQVLMAALTLPRIEGESEDDYAARVITDSKEQTKKASERGTSLHGAIKRYAREGFVDPQWSEHVEAVRVNLEWAGIDLSAGTNEHSFVSPLGYGGMADWHAEIATTCTSNAAQWVSSENLLLDFKSKDSIIPDKKLVWDEHAEQLAAYGQALFGGMGLADNPMILTHPSFRAMNVFIGVDDKKVVIVEHEWKDLVRGWRSFTALLDYWKAKNLFN